MSSPQRLVNCLVALLVLCPALASAQICRAWIDHPLPPRVLADFSEQVKPPLATFRDEAARPAARISAALALQDLLRGLRARYRLCQVPTRADDARVRGVLGGSLWPPGELEGRVWIECADLVARTHAVGAAARTCVQKGRAARRLQPPSRAGAGRPSAPGSTRGGGEVGGDHGAPASTGPVLPPDPAARPPGEAKLQAKAWLEPAGADAAVIAFELRNRGERTVKLFVGALEGDSPFSLVMDGGPETLSCRMAGARPEIVSLRPGEAYRGRCAPQVFGRGERTRVRYDVTSPVDARGRSQVPHRCPGCWIGELESGDVALSHRQGDRPAPPSDKAAR